MKKENVIFNFDDHRTKIVGGVCILTISHPRYHLGLEGRPTVAFYPILTSSGKYFIPKDKC